MQIPVPGGVNRRAQEFAPFGIETAVASRDIAITQDDGLRKRLAGGRPYEITDIRVASGESPIGRGFILNIRRAKKNARRAEFVGTDSEVIRPIRRIHAPSVGYRKIPGILIEVIVRPNFKAETHLFEIVDTSNAFGLG